MDIIDKLIDVESDVIKKAFIEIVSEYIRPSFGSMSKREFDILLFSKLQDIKVFDKDPEVYELVRSLRVTRNKARNLLYESKLRKTDEDELNEELKNTLINAMFFKDGENISLEIGNPLLVDHIKDKLKKLGHITDGSFSNELIKMKTSAFINLFEEMMSSDNPKYLEEVKQKLIDCGAKKDTSFSGVMKSFLGKAATKVIGDVGNEFVGELSKCLSAIMKNESEEVFEKYVKPVFSL